MSNKNNEKDNKDLENKESIDEKSLITSDPEDENIEDTEGYINASFKEKLSLKFRKRLISNRMNTFILVLFLIVLFIGVNMFANSKDLAQIDVTENKLYSLTQASKDQLAHLDKDINIYIYGFTEDNVYVNLVKQYAAYSDKIHYEIVTEETNYEVVTKYELSNSNYNAFVVVCGDRDKTLYPDYEFSSYDNETGDTIDITEETITNAILNVSTDDPVKVYFAAGNGEYTTSEITGLITYLEAQVYECEELNLLSVTEIPEDCDILAILDPTEDFNEDEANAVKSYINKGGNIFFGMFKQSETAQFPNLQSILDLYGVTIDFGSSFIIGSTIGVSIGLFISVLLKADVLFILFIVFISNFTGSITLGSITGAIFSYLICSTVSGLLDTTGVGSTFTGITGVILAKAVLLTGLLLKNKAS